MDIKLSYTEQGSGEPLILLHGNGESKEYFEHQIPHFSDRYRVLALDTRGHGESPRGTAPFKITQFAEDLKDFMDQMGLKKASILGFSDGGNIALTFALKYQDRIDKMILNGANIFPEGMAEPGYSAIMAAYESNKQKMLEHPEEEFRIARQEMLALMVEEPHISLKELRGIKVPTLVIAGTDDMIIHEHTELIAEGIPDSRIVFIEGDHFIANKKFEEFNRAVDDFLSE